jgi:hypothetical protein
MPRRDALQRDSVHPHPGGLRVPFAHEIDTSLGDGFPNNSKRSEPVLRRVTES